VAYEGLVAPLVAGRAGQAAHENRLLSSSAELFDARGVTFEDRHVRKEAGATNFDAAGVGTAQTFTGTLSASRQHISAITSSLGSGTILLVDTVVGDADTSPLTFLTGTAAVGNAMLVSVAQKTGSASTITVTDSNGHTYTQLAKKIGGTDVPLTVATFGAILTSGLPAGGTITVTSTATGSLAAVASEFSGVVTVSDRSATAVGPTLGGTAITTGPLPPSQATPVLLIESLATNGSTADTLTPTSGFTNTSKRSNSALTMTIFQAYRIDTVVTVIIAAIDWYSGLRIPSGGVFKAATTSGSTTVTGSAGTLWTTGTEAQRIFSGDTIVLYNATDMESRVVSSVASDTSLTTTETWTTTFTATDYVVVRGSRFITATTGGNIFKERNSDLDAVTLASNLSRVARPGKFIVCGKEDGNRNRKLIYVNGYNAPQGLVDDGSTMSPISTPNVDWDATATNAAARPWNGVVHRNRVVVVCPKGKDPHRLYYSDPTNHGDFNGAGATSQRVRSETGDEIWGLTSFQGVLWVWKYPVGIFYIDDGDTDTSLWIERTKSQSVGCAPSPFSVLTMDDDVIFMSATGAFHILSAVDTLGGVRASDLSWHLGLNKWLRDNLNLARLNQVLSVWYPHKKVALFAVPSVGSTSNDLVLRWDFSGVEQGEPAKFSYSERDTPDMLALKKAADGIFKPVAGEGVFVKLLDQEARNKEGAAYTGRYQTPHLDLSHLDVALAYRRKLFEHLELLMEPVAAGTLTVDVYVDNVLKETLTFDATQRRQRKKLNSGDGFTISLRVTNEVVDEDFKVLAHLVYFKPGNEDQNR